MRMSCVHLSYRMMTHPRKALCPIPDSSVRGSCTVSLQRARGLEHVGLHVHMCTWVREG